MVVAGEGKERFAHVFLVETGTSNGDISGQSKALNSCDFKPTRPFRVVTGSEDNSVGIFEGPPFKFKMTKQDHSRFVQCVRFSPSGEYFASAGFDGKLFIHDTKEYKTVCELGSPAHKGGIYSVAWSPNSKQLLSASGDKTCKLWNVEDRTMVSEFVMGTTIEDQQVSCLWQGQHLLSVSLSGFINYLDVNNPEKPLRVVKGHNKPITALEVNRAKKSIYTASHDGFITAWDAVTGENERINGAGHGNQVNGMVLVDGRSLYTIGIDDSLREINVGSREYTQTHLKLQSQPRGVSAYGDRIVIACVNQVVAVKGGKQVASVSVDFEPSSASINGEHPDVAIGGTSDHKVHIYTLSENVLTHQKELVQGGAITDVKFSPDCQFLAAADANRRICVYRLPTYELAWRDEWGFHSAKVNSIAWSPNSLFVASGGLDCVLIIWSVEKPSKHLIIKNAHPQSQITNVAWLDDSAVVTVGQDSNTKIWEIQNFP
ncbi:actin-interacting protein 1-like isoform X2 [Artemia franciscana]|nr:hypothetical protein QYM36_015961 [Artemia franciscana]KAK2705769.1 hypothetical protein QYM36_015961 [Artemia franciscana]KAK2705770.1 hypothetical protein QYM36_015961 [Artemia franciscana]